MQTITANNAHLALAYLTELVDEAKRLSPNDAVIRSGIAVSAGRRLNVVLIFTNQHDMPDLTSLAISKTAGECGAGFLKSFNPKAVRKQIHAFGHAIRSSAAP
jgi:hypothetical protein